MLPNSLRLERLVQNCNRSAIHCHVTAEFSWTSGLPTCTRFLGRSGNPNIGGEPLRENWNCIPTPVMAVHSTPLQGSQDIGSINGGIISKDLKHPDHLFHGPKGTLDLTSASSDVAVTVREHFLLLSLPLLQVPLECLAPALLFLSLAFLAVGGFMSHGDENFLLFGVALALGTPSMMPVQTSAAP